MELEKLLKEFAVKTVEEMYQKKETEKQVKAFSNKPKRVQVSIDDCKKLCKDAGLEYLDGYESRVVEHVISDETADRYGDIVRAAGADLKNYKKNPVILFAHEHSGFPIGNSVKVWGDKAEKKVKSWGLYFDDRIDPTGRADACFKLISAGAMPACSIGFLPTKANRPNTKEERAQIGLGEYGTEFTAWELLEYSACSVPANPNALLNMVKDKSLTKKDCVAIKSIGSIIKDDFADELIKNVIDDSAQDTKGIQDDIVKQLLAEVNNSVKDAIKGFEAKEPVSNESKMIELMESLIKEVSELNTGMKCLSDTLNPLLDLKAIDPPKTGSENIEEEKEKGLYKMFEGDVKI